MILPLWTKAVPTVACLDPGILLTQSRKPQSGTKSRFTFFSLQVRGEVAETFCRRKYSGLIQVPEVQTCHKCEFICLGCSNVGPSYFRIGRRLCIQINAELKQADSIDSWLYYNECYTHTSFGVNWDMHRQSRGWLNEEPELLEIIAKWPYLLSLYWRGSCDWYRINCIGKLW